MHYSKRTCRSSALSQQCNYLLLSPVGVQFLSLATPSPILLYHVTAEGWQGHEIQNLYGKVVCYQNWVKYGKTLRYFILDWHIINLTRNVNNFPTFNFSPVDSNFCYRYSQVLSYIKKFHIKRPEEEQEIANTDTFISRRKMVALLIKSLAWFKEVGVQLWSWHQCSTGQMHMKGKWISPTERLRT